MKRVSFVFAFVVASVIGTLSHEAGHFFAANALGYETTLHYGSVSWDSSPMGSQIDSLSALMEITLDSTAEYSMLLQAWKKAHIERRPHTMIILASGPLQTILTSSIGLSILFIRRRQKVFDKIDWAMVFLALFMSRMIFNPLVSSIKYLTGKSDNLFTGDEHQLALMASVPPATLILPLFLIAISICTLVVFRFIPKEFRFRFIISGLLGSGLGYVLWMFLLGPIVLP